MLFRLYTLSLTFALPQIYDLKARARASHYELLSSGVSSWFALMRDFVLSRQIFGYTVDGSRFEQHSQSSEVIRWSRAVSHIPDPKGFEGNIHLLTLLI